MRLISNDLSVRWKIIKLRANSLKQPASNAEFDKTQNLGWPRRTTLLAHLHYRTTANKANKNNTA